jgi:hypothetical protein
MLIVKTLEAIHQGLLRGEAAHEGLSAQSQSIISAPDDSVRAKQASFLIEGIDIEGKQ